MGATASAHQCVKRRARRLPGLRRWHPMATFGRDARRSHGSSERNDHTRAAWALAATSRRDSSTSTAEPADARSPPTTFYCGSTSHALSEDYRPPRLSAAISRFRRSLAVPLPRPTRTLAVTASVGPRTRAEFIGIERGVSTRLAQRWRFALTTSMRCLVLAVPPVGVNVMATVILRRRFVIRRLAARVGEIFSLTVRGDEAVARALPYG
jgi:hypothetical protein